MSSAVQQRILLFDVDGVIVDPIAYRIGVTYTLKQLGELIGLADLGALMPSEKEIASMEANGVHDVWDMTNIIFAIWLTEIALKTETVHSVGQDSDGSVAEQLRQLQQLKPSVDRPDYAVLATKLHPTSEFSHPPDIALHFLEERISSLSQRDAWGKLIRKFLIGTRSAYSSFGTRLFQNIILGNEVFERTYGLPSDYDGQGLLQQEDKTLISNNTVAQLLQQNKQNDVAVGIYTARPSLPPKDAALPPLGYSPEAEIALQNAGMQSLPLIAMGMMEWLAKERNERTEDLTKPNRTQALAALINTINGGHDVEALQQAYEIDKQNLPAAETDLSALKDQKTKIYVFEDTISGIVPMLAVADLLRKQNFDIEVDALGIAHDDKKIVALKKHCSQVFPDVNQAFDSIK